MPRAHNFGTDTLLTAARSAAMLTPDEELRFVRSAANGCTLAFERLVRSHLRLVIAIARESGHYGTAMDELISEGTLGLVEAARRFDPERGTRLATYAAWWIRAYVRRYALSNRRIVRPPSSRRGRELVANLRRVQRELGRRTGERPSKEAVAFAMGVEPREIEEAETALSARDVSFGLEGRDSGVELPSELPSAEIVVGEIEAHAHCRALLDGALERLSQRERDVLSKRHLLEEVRSLASIANDMGLSRERVRQIECKAQQKVREMVIAAST